MMGRGRIIAIIVLIGILSASAYLLTTQEFAGVGLEEAIWCEGYTYISCGEYIAGQGSKNIGPEMMYKCPNTASHCIVRLWAGETATQQTKVAKTVNASKCQINAGAWFCKDKYYCPDESISILRKDVDLVLYPGQAIYDEDALLDNLGSALVNCHQILNTKIDYKVYAYRLVECGDSACNAATEGTVWPGSQGCSFPPEGRTYDNFGNIIDEGGKSMVAVPAPPPRAGYSNNYRTVDQNKRHICGYIDETCSEATGGNCNPYQYPIQYNWGGKLYGAVCTGRGSLSLYGCVGYGTPLDERNINESGTKDDPINEGPVDTLNYSYGSKCKLISGGAGIPVGCCQASDCGLGSFCDINTFTCKESVDCTQDAECSKGQQCDATGDSPILKESRCIEGKCKHVTVQNVACCSNADCGGEDQRCSGFPDYKCVEVTPEKAECPNLCCKDEPLYYDKLCPAGQECCADQTCALEGACEAGCNENEKCEPEIGETKENCPSDCEGCDSDNDCPKDFICKDGVCIEDKGNGGFDAIFILLAIGAVFMVVGFTYYYFKGRKVKKRKR